MNGTASGRLPAAACAAVLLLASPACSDRKEAALSNEQVTAQVAQLRFQPGEWETRTEITGVDIPGAPRGAPTQAGQTQTARTCLTRTQAANPDAGFISGNAGGGCRAERLQLDGGRIDGRFICRPQGLPGTAIAEVDGSYTRTAFRTAVKSRIDLTGLPDVSIDALVTSRRVGECLGEA